MIKRFLFPIVLVVSLFFSFVLFMNLYPEFLWYDSFQYASVWLFRIKAEIITWALFTGISVVWLFFHVSIANRNSSKASQSSDYQIQTPFAFLNQIINQFKASSGSSGTLQSVTKQAYGLLIAAVTVGLSVLFGLAAKSWWEELYLYLNQTPYGVTDPIFNQDISFYLFSLPLLNQVQNWFVSLFVITLIVVGWIYLSKNILLVIFSKNKEFGAIKKHVISLVSITFILFAVGTVLNIFDILFSTNGAVFGAGFTDVYVTLVVKKILIVLYILEALLVLSLIAKPTFKLPYIVLVLIVACHFFGGRVLPGVVQNYLVSPNELVKEKDFIKHNINFTREAYGLSGIQEVQFPASQDLKPQDIEQNQTIVGNIRLWNQEPLKQTFRELQEIRLYYEFENVDVDRYMVNGRPQQVMLSARELDSTQLTQQAQTWTNRHLIYTHGYGVCMTPVNEVTKEGLPEFFIKDLPPVSSVGITVTEPAIYFGEKTSDYVFVKTKQKEFDYPKGDSNVYTTYSGTGGILLDSFIKRLVYALKFSDFKILFTSQITQDSRLLYDRVIQQIPKKIAPFLIFDKDPYLVISDEGRLVWIFDGYTISNYFPYSEPFNGRVNYIRNSAKVTIDAYSGETHFYLMDTSDPLIKAYAKVYKGLFKSLDDMPVDIAAHLRYPKDLFSVQASMLNTYHMTDPQVFYNREDLWQFPQETYEGSEKTMSPYYLVTKLPGQTKESFVLMLPFTPSNKNNMIAWLAASCDLNEYGSFTVLKLPKEKTIYGPMQIESRIDQHTEISKNLTLWGQMGSRVIRGNLMIIPIKESLLYVEPIYLQATQSKLPELKRVIVSYADEIVMANNLTDAILELFDVSKSFLSSVSEAATTKTNLSITLTQKEKIQKVISVFSSLKQNLKQSEWSAFGINMEELEQSINQLETVPEK